MNKIISFVMVGTNNLEKSSKFYDAVFVHLGLKKVSTTERMISYAHSNDPHEVKFYITKPYNEKPATIGNGTMVALLAESNEAVDKFHATALENGAIDEGAPGLRSDGNYYGYVRDLDGNKITAKCISNWVKKYIKIAIFVLTYIFLVLVLAVYFYKNGISFF